MVPHKVTRCFDQPDRGCGRDTLLLVWKLTSLSSFTKKSRVASMLHYNLNADPVYLAGTFIILC